MIKMDKYRLTTTKQEDGSYCCKVTYNDGEVSAIPSDPIPGILGEYHLQSIKTLADNPKLSRIEVILSGEKL